ncbi:MAG TPA: LysR family transcriptional regulator [Xanthobacteraceae bacterium]|nr:LysR family transcriptional regulator [Xanthobacteraceae bacterium]
MFNWNDLVFFLELARQGRLSPAARRLKVDLTTVSRRISELEKDLAVKLFERRPDGFLLTEDGHKLLAVAEKMEALALPIAESSHAAPSEPSGRVRLATMEGIAAFYLADKLADFNAVHPDIVVELVTERHLINLTKREADVSISFVPPAGPRLDVRKAGTFKLGLFGSAAYLERHGTPRTVEELSDHNFVDYIADLVAIAKVHWLLDVLEPEHVVFRSSSMAAQQNAIAAGQGLGLLPYFSAKREPRLVPVVPDRVVVERELYVSVHDDIQFMGRVRALTRFLFALFKKDAVYLNTY